MARFPASSVTPLRDGGQTIIMPPRAPVAPIVVCPECPPPGTVIAPVEDWQDLHELTELFLDDITRDGSVYTLTPSDTTTTVFMQRITTTEPTGAAITSLLCVLLPEDPAVFLAQLWAITSDNGVYIAEYEDHFSTRFLNITLFLSGQNNPYAQDDYWVYSQILSAYQKDGGIDQPVRFRIKAIELPVVPLP